MPEKKEATSVKKSKMSPIVGVGIGCFILLLLVGTGISFAVRFFAKKAGVSVLQGAIENKTGIKTNLQDIEKGKMTFTDSKTGQTVSVGSQKLPDTFPKDFPVYTNATVAGSVSGVQDGKGNGFLVTFATSDGLDKVVPFYTKELASNGWRTTASFNSDTVQTWAVSKGAMEGSVSITSENDQTTILVAIGNKE